MSVSYVDWGGRVKLTWLPSTELPERKLITSVHAFCFDREQLLMVNLKNRGWDFPGGHIEVGETPEDCVKREVLEEAYAKGLCTLLGMIEVNHSENDQWNEKSPYPLVGYQVFYRIDLTELLPFEGKYESTQRILIDPNEIANYYTGWNETHQAILEKALTC
ncbi:NUDIX domain-containing protein [Lederbergia sp. NSJ-179]|uniref:NUDIX hydrolase n=1 Tax=Lederbergia sp. NSJ-179 TaxID=2931402 RepID=UPI001FD10DA3|nr:NUDIX domain-containing protein [Lederbergia sp. NSJ-179]MCJ7842369.1 NUDIX domain-containing protein [Lederbergia sp. NSJ-179]